MTAVDAIDFAELTSRYLATQLAGDRREALRLVVDEGLDRGARVIDLQAYVVRPAQVEIGRLWQANRISIAQEHLATGISQLVMARLYEHVRPQPRNGRSVVVACVEGELHDLPARLVADYLDQGGFAVRYYGADVPTDELVPLLQTGCPDLLALSATMSFHIPALRDAVARVRRSIDGKLAIVIGGHAVDWSASVAADLGVATAPGTPEQMIAAARQLTGAA